MCHMSVTTWTCGSTQRGIGGEIQWQIAQGNGGTIVRAVQQTDESAREQEDHCSRQFCEVSE